MWVYGIFFMKFIFFFVFKACSSLIVIEYGEEIYSYVLWFGLDLDVYIFIVLVDLYVKCGVLV